MCRFIELEFYQANVLKNTRLSSFDNLISVSLVERQPKSFTHRGRPSRKRGGRNY